LKLVHLLDLFRFKVMVNSKYFPYVSTLVVLFNIYLSRIYSTQCSANIGVAFGIYFELLNLLIPFLIFILLLISIYSSNRLKNIFVSLCILGMSNAIERLVNGYICDFLTVFDISFNIVDMGIVLLCIFGILVCISKRDEKYC